MGWNSATLTSSQQSSSCDLLLPPHRAPSNHLLLRGPARTSRLGSPFLPTSGTLRSSPTLEGRTLEPPNGRDVHVSKAQRLQNLTPHPSSHYLPTHPQLLQQGRVRRKRRPTRGILQRTLRFRVLPSRSHQVHPIPSSPPHRPPRRSSYPLRLRCTPHLVQPPPPRSNDPSHPHPPNRSTSLPPPMRRSSQQH